MYVEAEHTWEGANALCGQASNGKASLASIHSQDENNHVLSLFNNKAGINAWIGGSITADGSGSWIDGSAIDYTNWASGEPNGNAAQAIFMCGMDYPLTSPGKWIGSDFLKSGIRGLVCSYSKGKT